jgi:CheY-like chemotaxis protein
MSAPLRVLIADDDRDAVLTLGILLRSEGYDVRLAQSGKDAVALALEARPDVALLDLHMPGYSGLRVAQELQHHYSRDCPLLVAVTARTHDRQLAEISGFHHFVAKPYDPRALLALLNSVLSVISISY